MNIGLLKKKTTFWVAGGVFLTVALVFQNCGQPGYIIEDPNQTLTRLSDTPPGTGGPDDVICDPASTPTTLKNGLMAELYYMTKDGAKNATTVNAFFDPDLAVKSTKQVFFTQVNTPPQIFSHGFTTQTQDVVRDDSGQVLKEWFALKYFSEIQLTDADQEGTYEFAALSDDGVIFEAFVEDKWQTVITDDGLHSPKWGCSIKTLDLKKNVSVPIRIYYYQGPAQHISNMLHWRRITPGSAAVVENECGKSGTDYFYNPNTSVPLSPYRGLLNRGWKVVPQDNFLLPQNIRNPCVK